MKKLKKPFLKRRFYFGSLFMGLALLWFTGCKGPAELPPGDPGNGGLFLPNGFEAVVVADSVGPARHLAVNDNGDIYVKLRFSKGGKAGNVALRDTTHDGKADIIKRFGAYEDKGGYGTAMRIHDGYLYFSSMKVVYRNKLTPGKLIPESKSEVVLTDDHDHGIHWHMTKPVAFDDKGNMFVPFGAPSNACQDMKLTPAGKPGFAGLNPCPELENHGGIWKFDATKTGLTQKDGQRFATGLRSIVAMDWNPVDKNLYVVMHGRDDLFLLFPNYYTPWQSAVLPSEEFLRIKEGSDAGWPYYYYDQLKGKKIQAPEYGGDGMKEGKGGELLQPIMGFSAHWAPNDLMFYHGDQFPEHYKNGAFIAFHGSTNRAPYPQAGYFIGFVPFKDGEPTGPWEVFADGFAGIETVVNTSDAVYRPMGIAMGPDGSLYFSESQKGKIWRVMFKGDKDKFGTAELAEMEKRKTRSNIRTPDETKDNLDKGKAVSPGTKVYMSYCSACHQRNGKGDGSRFPPLGGSEWVIGDKKKLINVLLKGLEGPIKVKGNPYNGLMAPHNFLSNHDVAEVLTYIRKNFGNHAGAIKPDEVAQVRKAMKKKK